MAKRVFTTEETAQALCLAAHIYVTFHRACRQGLGQEEASLLVAEEINRQAAQGKGSQKITQAAVEYVHSWSTGFATAKHP
jgi:hypothetical protein